MDFKQKLLNNPEQLKKIDVDFRVELASKEIAMQDVLSLQEGSVFVFDEDLDQPLSIVIRGAKIAEGILVQCEGGYGIKITKTLLELDL